MPKYDNPALFMRDNKFYEPGGTRPKRQGSGVITRDQLGLLVNFMKENDLKEIQLSGAEWDKTDRSGSPFSVLSFGIDHYWYDHPEKRGGGSNKSDDSDDDDFNLD